MKKNYVLFICLCCLTLGCFAQKSYQLSLIMQPDEKWWSGIVSNAEIMPFADTSDFSFNMLGNNKGNQVQPLLMSNKGRYIWSEVPFKFEIKNKQINIEGNGIVDTGTAGKTLYDVQHYVRNRYFPASGKLPDVTLFTAPQYNTWIELNYNQNQEAVLKYAHAIIDNGFPPGVLMIDATWEERVGTWKFHPGLFPDPKKMMYELHQLGFKVMLWVCPFVSADSKEFRYLAEKKFLVRDSILNENPYIVKWWDGYSAEIDLSNSGATKWFKEQLNYLQDNYNIDGFKFDAGDFNYYPPNIRTTQKLSANEHSRLFVEFGMQYKLNEFRACWKMGGMPIAQRLRDKEHTWEDNKKLIPGILLSGLVGYTFSCPDMIGGGEIASFWGDNYSIDQDLLVRSAQCSALMPMMQFSVAPWRVLDSVHFDAVKKSVVLRKKFTPLILQLARQSAQSGEPIVKHIDYVFPNQGFQNTNDQFLLGDSILVAPMLEKGKLTRTVKFPKLKKGKWKGDDGKIYKGGLVTVIEVVIDRLPYFKIVN